MRLSNRVIVVQKIGLRNFIMNLVDFQPHNVAVPLALVTDLPTKRHALHLGKAILDDLNTQTVGENMAGMSDNPLIGDYTKGISKGPEYFRNLETRFKHEKQAVSKLAFDLQAPSKDRRSTPRLPNAYEIVMRGTQKVTAPAAKTQTLLPNSSPKLSTGIRPDCVDNSVNKSRKNAKFSVKLTSFSALSAFVKC